MINLSEMKHNSNSHSTYDGKHDVELLEEVFAWLHHKDCLSFLIALPEVFKAFNETEL